jgi:hypothetical protein
MGSLLVDQTIVLEGPSVTEAGNRIDRYRGEPLSDDQLMSHALDNGYDALVLSGYAHLVSDVRLDSAVDRGLIVVVSRESDPLRAGERVTDHADALVRAPSGGFFELLAGGLVDARRDADR